MKKKPMKMYVLVRNDLDSVYRMVQGTHAVAAFYEQGNDTTWHNDTLVTLAVRNLRSLEFWKWKLGQKKKNWVGFYEPDIDDQLTAIACVDSGEIFKNLPLAK